MNRIAGMTGPEHFLAGEDLLQRSGMIDFDQPDGAAQSTALAAQAQAHFTAAQTLAFAALAAESVTEDRFAELSSGWARLLGVKAAAE